MWSRRRRLRSTGHLGVAKCSLRGSVCACPWPSGSVLHQAVNHRLDRANRDSATAADKERSKLPSPDQLVYLPSADSEPIGNLVDRQIDLDWGCIGTVVDHAALPVAETSAARASRARSLASASALCQRSRSATACNKRLLGGR